VSPTGGRLAVGHANGTVRVWAPTAADAAIPFSIDQTFSPFEDALASVSWAGSNSIVVGGRAVAARSRTVCR